MNIRTQTDIDHAIAAACDLHDLRAGQTGTKRKRRKRTPCHLLDRTGNDEAPAAQDDYRDHADAALLGLEREYERCRQVWLGHRLECDRLIKLSDEARDAGLEVLAKSRVIITDSMRTAALYAARFGTGYEAAAQANNDALDAMVKVADLVRAEPAHSVMGILIKARVLMGEVVSPDDYFSESDDDRPWEASCFIGFLADIERLAGLSR